jgi:hypothetical protein
LVLFSCRAKRYATVFVGSQFARSMKAAMRWWVEDLREIEKDGKREMG